MDDFYAQVTSNVYGKSELNTSIVVIIPLTVGCLGDKNYVS